MLNLFHTKKSRIPFLLKGFVYFSLVLLLSTLSECVDPYYPHLENYGSLLVVEGLITNQNRHYEVKLSRTVLSQDKKPEAVSDASVSITDNEGGTFDFIGNGNGTYRSDSVEFNGEAGKTYVLHIKTKEGMQYESEPVIMQPVAEIDTLYFEKSEAFINDREDIQPGITIYLDSEKGDDLSKYYRWDYEETWKFRIPNPHRYEYINDTEIVAVNNVREFCWKNHKSDNIKVKSVLQGESGFIRKEPVCFIPSAKSDRLTTGYSILVRQYSLSEKEYDFWTNLKQINESGGDIFEKQPYSVPGNIVSLDNPEEKVLGYFQVSGVSEKRLFIKPEQLDELKLPGYKSDCQRFVVCPDDYPSNPPAIPRQTFNSINEMFMATGDFTFVEPLYDTLTGELMKLVFSMNSCSKCEMTGDPVKPDFWIDF